MNKNFSEKYNSFVNRWNSGDEINDPYKETSHKVYSKEYSDVNEIIITPIKPTM